MKRLYAAALSRTSASGGDSKMLVGNLMTHLKAVGRTKLLPGILRELTMLEERKAKTAPVVEVAHHKDASRALAGAAEAGITAKKAETNPDLISGWRARGNGMLVDRSGKRALIELYRGITKA